MTLTRKPPAFRDARFGRFTREPIDGVTLYVCGVCLARYDWPHEKAAHLREAHNARVRMDGDLYSWERD